jgi:hypothetical protein
MSFRKVRDIPLKGATHSPGAAEYLRELAVWAYANAQHELARGACTHCGRGRYEMAEDRAEGFVLCDAQLRSLTPPVMLQPALVNIDGGDWVEAIEIWIGQLRVGYVPAKLTERLGPELVSATEVRAWVGRISLPRRSPDLDPAEVTPGIGIGLELTRG